jgi:hypothetical protein
MVSAGLLDGPVEHMKAVKYYKCFLDRQTYKPGRRSRRVAFAMGDVRMAATVAQPEEVEPAPKRRRKLPRPAPASVEPSGSPLPSSERSSLDVSPRSVHVHAPGSWANKFVSKRS